MISTTQRKEKVMEKNKFDDNGYKHGYWEVLYRNDKTYSSGYYNHGEYDGVWMFYSPNGKLISKTKFDNGTVVERYCTEHRLEKINKIIKKIKKLKLNDVEINHLKNELGL